jgi:hypothetical protein
MDSRLTARFLSFHRHPEATRRAPVDQRSSVSASNVIGALHPGQCEGGGRRRCGFGTLASTCGGYGSATPFLVCGCCLMRRIFVRLAEWPGGELAIASTLGETMVPPRA